MKLVTKLIVVATLATFMFGTINLTWGNAYTNTADDLTVTNQFGVWLDVNDSMAFGWEGAGIKVGFDGPAGMQARMGYDTAAGAGTTVGMSRTWWTSTGDGWGTNLSTALDWGVAGTGAGNWTLTMNLGFGVWLDVNDSMAFGWEGDGIKVGFGGPAGMTVRLGYDTTANGEVGSTLGMSRTWWTSTGDGWGTSLSTALDFNMTGGTGADGNVGGGDDVAAGTWVLTMNLGFGF